MPVLISGVAYIPKYGVSLVFYTLVLVHFVLSVLTTFWKMTY